MPVDIGSIHLVFRRVVCYGHSSRRADTILINGHAFRRILARRGIIDKKTQKVSLAQRRPRHAPQENSRVLAPRARFSALITFHDRIATQSHQCLTIHTIATVLQGRLLLIASEAQRCVWRLAFMNASTDALNATPKSCTSSRYSVRRAWHCDSSCSLTSSVCSRGGYCRFRCGSVDTGVYPRLEADAEVSTLFHRW